jgi:hypothetical protein
MTGFGIGPTFDTENGETWRYTAVEEKLKGKVIASIRVSSKHSVDIIFTDGSTWYLGETN